MAYVSVPKDLTNIKTKFMGNFTKRQVVCFGLGALAGFPTYFLVRGIAGTTGGFYALIAVMLPFFLFGMVEKNGMPLEKYVKYFIQHKFVNPPVRVYKTETIYSYYVKMAEKSTKGENNGTGNTKKSKGRNKKAKG